MVEIRVSRQTYLWALDALGSGVFVLLTTRYTARGIPSGEGANRMSYSDEMEALEQERMDADAEQAELVAAGRAHAKGHRRMLALRAAGDLVNAAKACKHGGGYPLASLAAKHENDPRQGETGWRCSDCGSVMSDSPWDDGVVVHPCELEVK